MCKGVDFIPTLILGSSLFHYHFYLWVGSNEIGSSIICLNAFYFNYFCTIRMALEY